MKTVKPMVLLASIILQAMKLRHTVGVKSKNQALLQQVLKIMPMTPSQLIEHLQGRKGTEHDFQLCLGKLFAGEQCYATLNDQVKVIKSWLIEGEHTSKFRTLKKNEPSFMQVRDAQNHINLFETHQATISPTMMLRKVMKNRVSKIKNFLKKPFKSIGDKKDPFMGDYLYDSDKVKELYLPEGSQNVVLGQFKQEASGAACYKPLIIAPSKEHIRTQISQASLKNSLLGAFLVVGIAFTVGLLIREGYLMFSQVKEPADIIDVLKKIFVKSRICSVCGVHVCSILVKPCRHMTTCKQCWGEKEDCPQCGAKVQSILQMYVC